jgi:hypothetical protein
VGEGGQARRSVDIGIIINVRQARGKKNIGGDGGWEDEESEESENR